jgi:chromosome segregation ATPase
MADSRTLSLYVHKAKALEAEVDRLRAALRVQRELLDIYADGWRANYDEQGRAEADGGESSLQRCNDRQTALIRQLNDSKQALAEALDKAIAAHDALSACVKERDDWKAEALLQKEQVISLSRQLKDAHQMLNGINEMTFALNGEGALGDK